MTEIQYSIARHFSPTPGPRFSRQGPYSGESLRAKLVKLLDESDAIVTVDLDGTRGFGSSFLDEAFGGLVRSEHKAKNDILRRFKFKSTVDPSYIAEILESIQRAEPAIDTAH